MSADTRQATILLPEELLAELERRAAERGISRNAVIQEAIRHYLEEE